MRVFWEKGFEGTAMRDLIKAMGINRPSLYGAFGNKEELFRKALDRYAEGPAGYVREALKEATARAVAERLLYGAVEVLADPNNPHGCLTVQGALACGDAAESVRKELISRRVAAEAELQKRLERAKREGDLPADANSRDLASYVATVVHGMSVEAQAGASRERLRGVAKMALKAWPEVRT